MFLDLTKRGQFLVSINLTDVSLISPYRITMSNGCSYSFTDIDQSPDYIKRILKLNNLRAKTE